MVKLKDVAQSLNVSVSTVSRVVNNRDRVDPDTRKKILEALRKMNYLPDENARRLKTNVSNVLGVIVPDLSNPFYALAIKGIERTAIQEGYSVLVCNTDENREREKNALRLLLRQKVAGLVAATTFGDSDALASYAGLDRPVVFFDNIPPVHVQINCVTIDNVQAARELTQYMIGLGHRRILMISGPAEEFSADQRLLGWRLAMQEAGVDPAQHRFAHGDFREESGRRIMEQALTAPERPTAVCVANNFMAYGAVKAILDAGLSIPGDISVGAFDVVDTTGLMKFDMTAIVQPIEEIGRIAAELCIRQSKPDALRTVRRVVLEYRFLQGGTVRPVSP